MTKRERVLLKTAGWCTRCMLDLVSTEDRVAIIRDHSGLASRSINVILSNFGFDHHRPLWDMDHIVPLAEGGEDTLDNLQALCQPCHKEKTAEQAARKARRPSKVANRF